MKAKYKKGQEVWLWEPNIQVSSYGATFPSPAIIKDVFIDSDFEEIWYEITFPGTKLKDTVEERSIYASEEDVKKAVLSEMEDEDE